MSIQEDILDTIGTGGIEVAALRKAVGNISTDELNCAVHALMRARRLQVVHNRYEVIRSSRPLGGMPHTGRPPSAEQEAAASLQPKTLVCATCGHPKPENEFRLLPNDKRACICNKCHGEKTRKGLEERRQRLAAADLKFHSAQRQTDNPERRGDNRDVSTERCRDTASVSETSESYSRSDPREDARTPAGSGIVSLHIGSVNGSGGAHLADVRPAGSSAPTAASRLSGPQGECASGTTSKPVVTEPQGNEGESPALSSNTVAQVRQPEVMNSPVSAAQGTEARDLIHGHQVIGLGVLSSKGADSARPADRAPPPALTVLERAQAKRQDALNRLALLKVDIANTEMVIGECDRFMELYERFAIP